MGLNGAAWTVTRLPLAHVLGLVSVGLLPEVLRRRFGVRWTPAKDLQLRALSTTLQATTPLMPSWLRNTGPGCMRWRHQEIARRA